MSNAIISPDWKVYKAKEQPPQWHNHFNDGACEQVNKGKVLMCLQSSYYSSVFDPDAGKIRQVSFDIAKDAKFQLIDGDVAMNIATKFQEKLAEGKLSLTMPLTNYQSGADPEVFVVDAKGKVIPAFTFLKAKPDVPSPAKPFWDGFQAEFTTLASTCIAAGPVDGAQAGLKAVLKAARVIDPAAKLTPLSTMKVTKKVLKESADEHVAFGCSPSISIYNHPGAHIGNGRDLQWRFAGSHKHFGCGALTEEAKNNVIRALDRIYGVALVSLCASFDNPIRRQFYGRPGEHRLPSHGLEYRVPSSMDLCHPVIYNLSWDLARAAFHFGHKNFLNLWQTTDDETFDVIVNCDYPQARKILERNSTVLKALIEPMYGCNNQRAYTQSKVIGAMDACSAAYRTILNGIESLIKDPMDMEGNWLLNGKWDKHTNNDNLTFIKWVNDEGLN